MLVLLFPTVLYASGGWGTLVTHNSPNQNNYDLISDGLVQVTSQDTGEVATVYTRDLYRLADALDYYISMPVVGKALIMQTAEAYDVDWNDWGVYVHPTDVDVLYTDSAYLYANPSGYTDSNYDKYSGVNAGNNLSARGHITSYDTVNRVGLLPTTSIDTSQLPTFDNAKTYSFTEYGGNTLPTVCLYLTYNFICIVSLYILCYIIKRLIFIEDWICFMFRTFIKYASFRRI